MSLQPLLEASWVIQLHAYAAIIALLLGTIQIIAPKGTLPHKTLGAIWVVIMFAIAISSIFIRPSVFGYDLPLHKWFSPIHLFTALTFINLVIGLGFIARGGPTTKRHSGPFVGIFIGGLVIAGALSFLPGRIMHQVVFGG